MLKMSLADILNLLMIVLGLYAFFLLEFFVGPPVVVGAALRHIKSEYFLHILHSTFDYVSDASS